MIKKVKLFVLSLLLLTTVAYGIQDSTFSPKGIPITDEPTRKALVDSYKAILAADKDFQIALLKARIKCKVDESWSINLDTMTFHPPEPKKDEKVKP